MEGEPGQGIAENSEHHTQTAWCLQLAVIVASITTQEVLRSKTWGFSWWASV